MKPSSIKELIRAALSDPKNIQPIFLEGPPGVGKSAIVKQVTEEENIGFLDIRLAQRDPTDLRGMPAVIDEVCLCHGKPKKEGEVCPHCGGTGIVSRAKWLPPTDLPIIGSRHPAKGILFLDEMTSAPPLTQATAYQLTFDRRIGESVMMDGWYIIAAGNRIEDRAVVYRMSTALMNRFTHIIYDVNVDDWVRWALDTRIDPNIIGFIKWRPNLLAPDFNKESSEKAFATPRTWEFTSRLLKLIRSRTVLVEAIEGTIGKGCTAEFMQFLKLQTELPDLNKIFAGDNYVPQKVDMKYALVSALASRAVPKQFDRMLEYSDKLSVEFGILLVTLLVSKDMEAMAATKSWPKWAREHSDIIVSRKKLNMS